MAGIVDLRAGRTGRRLRRLSFPQELRARFRSAKVRHTRICGQSVQIVRQRPAGRVRARTRRYFQLEFRNGGHRAVAPRRQKYAGGGRLELRRQTAVGPDQFRTNGADRGSRLRQRTASQHRRFVALHPEYGLPALGKARMRVLCLRPGRADRQPGIPVGMGKPRFRRLGMEKSPARHERGDKRQLGLSRAVTRSVADPLVRAEKGAVRNRSALRRNHAARRVPGAENRHKHPGKQPGTDRTRPGTPDDRIQCDRMERRPGCRPDARICRSLLHGHLVG